MRPVRHVVRDRGMSRTPSERLIVALDKWLDQAVPALEKQRERLNEVIEDGGKSSALADELARGQFFLIQTLTGLAKTIKELKQ